MSAYLHSNLCALAQARPTHVLHVPSIVDARSGFMKTVQISLRMLLWTDSLCGAAEIVLCTYRILMTCTF